MQDFSHYLRSYINLNDEEASKMLITIVELSMASSLNPSLLEKKHSCRVTAEPKRPSRCFGLIWFPVLIIIVDGSI